MGFGANSRLQTTKYLRLSPDLPLVIEIVDSEEYIERLLPFLEAVIKGVLVTMEKVHIMCYQGQS